MICARSAFRLAGVFVGATMRPLSDYLAKDFAAHDMILADRFFDHSPLEWATVGFAGLGVVLFSASVACIIACVVTRFNRH